MALECEGPAQTVVDLPEPGEFKVEDSTGQPADHVLRLYQQFVRQDAGGLIGTGYFRVAGLGFPGSP